MRLKKLSDYNQINLMRLYICLIRINGKTKPAVMNEYDEAV